MIKQNVKSRRIASAFLWALRSRRWMRCAYLPPTKYATCAVSKPRAPVVEQMVDALRLSTPYKICGLCRAGKPRAPAVEQIVDALRLSTPYKICGLCRAGKPAHPSGSRWWMRCAYLPHKICGLCRAGKLCAPAGVADGGCASLIHPTNNAGGLTPYCG